MHRFAPASRRALRVGAAARQEGGDQQRRAAGWPDQGNVVRGGTEAVVVGRAGLVADRPAGRQAGLEACLAGRLGVQPVLQCFARRNAERNAPQAREHRARRSRVAGGVAPNVERGLGVVEPGQGVAERACEPGEGARAAVTREAQVGGGGGVVAVGEGRGAEFAERHAVATRVLLGDG